MPTPELDDAARAPAAPRPPKTARDRIGLFVQILLTLLGLLVALAPGFALRWSSQPLLTYRQPAVGFALIVLGLGARWLISSGFRQRSAARARRAAVRVREYAAGARTVPWHAAFWWVFLPALLIYQSNGRTLGSGDTAPMLETALSILTRGDVALDDFIDPSRPPYYVCRVGEHYYSRFSLGPAVAALPFVQLARWAGADLGDPLMRQRLEKVIASAIAAATAMLMFLILLRVTPARRNSTNDSGGPNLAPAVCLTVFYALASQNWSIASQALWQHGPVALCVAGVLFLEYGIAHPGRIWTCLLQGLLLGFAVACRPTAAILAAIFVLLTAVRCRRHLPLLLAGMALAYAPFALVHLHVYHSWLGPYAHAAAEDKWGADLAVSLPGNLVSPARGLLVYQPLLLLAVTALIPRLARRIGVGLTPALLTWCVLHLIVVSCYRHWWGGHAWGPRFLTELMPALVVLSAPAVVWLWRRRIGAALVAALAFWSIGLQALGVCNPGAQRWMKQPVDIDQTPERLWDWHAPPFLYPWR